MKTRVLIVALSAGLALAQSPNFSGVWKANLEKSKLNGPPPSSYLVIIDQQGSKLTEIVGASTSHGDERSSYTYEIGKPSTNPYRGSLMRTEAAFDGASLKLNSKLAMVHPGTVTETMALSPDGNTLTIDTINKSGDREQHQTLVLEKQPDSAGADLRKPEMLAGSRFKNVQILKEVPASQFIDIMRTFSGSLGVQCDHCHVQNNFAADDKPAKNMARKMLTLVHTTNETYFGGHPEVHCFTCHRGQVEPLSHPAFE